MFQFTLLSSRETGFCILSTKRYSLIYILQCVLYVIVGTKVFFFKLVFEYLTYVTVRYFNKVQGRQSLI